MSTLAMGKLYMSLDEFDKPSDQFTDQFEFDEPEEFA